MAKPRSSRAAAAPLPRRVVVIALIAAIAAFMQMLDSTILTTAVPQMAKTFRDRPTDLGIGITAYMITASIFIPTSGWMADRIGAKPLFMTAILGFTLASALCGFSVTLPQFVAARILQGTSGAFMVPVSAMILLRASTKREFVRAMTMATTPMLVAPVIGPPIGGFITTYLSWPWIFFLNLPIGIVGILATLRFLPSLPRAPGRPFDLRGFVLNGIALGGVTLGLGEIASDAIPLGASAACLAVGLTVGVLAVRHARTHSHPLVSLAPFAFSTFRISVLVGGPLVRLGITGINYLLPILLQVGFGYTAAWSGLILLCHTAGDLIMKAWVAQSLRALGYRRVIMGTATAMSLAVAACSLFTAATPFWAIGIMLFAAGCARSLLMTGCATLCYAEIRPEQQSSATILQQVGFQFWQGMSFAFAGLLVGVTTMLSPGSGGVADAGDYRLCLLIIGATSLLSLLSFRRLAPDAGAELSGHGAPDTVEAAAE
jgi:EmrB/QacA subfamily drug resistance transporter